MNASKTYIRIIEYLQLHTNTRRDPVYPTLTERRRYTDIEMIAKWFPRDGHQKSGHGYTRYLHIHLPCDLDSDIRVIFPLAHGPLLY